MGEHYNEMLEKLSLSLEKTTSDAESFLASLEIEFESLIAHGFAYGFNKYYYFSRSVYSYTCNCFCYGSYVRYR